MYKWTFTVKNGSGEIMSQQTINAPSASDAFFIWLQFEGGKQIERDVEINNLGAASGSYCHRISMEFAGVSDIELEYLTRSNEKRIDDKFRDSKKSVDIMAMPDITKDNQKATQL